MNFFCSQTSNGFNKDAFKKSLETSSSVTPLYCLSMPFLSVNLTRYKSHMVSPFSIYAALLRSLFLGQNFSPSAFSIAARSFLDLLLPATTWYMAVRWTPCLRAISLPEISFLSILIFILISNFIMIIENINKLWIFVKQNVKYA